jgi:hypothetical protein
MLSSVSETSGSPALAVENFLGGEARRDSPELTDEAEDESERLRGAVSTPFFTAEAKESLLATRGEGWDLGDVESCSREGELSWTCLFE